MKKFILFFFALVASVCAFAQGTADFNALEQTTNYAEYTTPNGWVATNCVVLVGHGGIASEDNNPSFAVFGEGNKAVCMNGKTSAVGKITSPVIEGGCGTLTFKYAHVYNETNGVNFTVTIVQDGKNVVTYNVVKSQTEIAKKEAVVWSEKVNVAGDFQVIFTNNHPTEKDGNADRYAIWDISWTGKTAGEPVLITDASQFSNNKCYSIQSVDRGYMVYAKNQPTYLSGSIRAGVEFDVTNPDHLWAFLQHKGHFYMYNVGQKKYVNFKSTNNADPTDLAELPTSDNLTFLASTGGNAEAYPLVIAIDGTHQFNMSKDQGPGVLTSWNSLNDNGNTLAIYEVADFDATEVLAALEDAKNATAEVTYNYTIGGKVWKTVVSEQKKGDVVAAPAAQAFVKVVSYDEAAVVAEGLVVNVVCEEALPFTTSTEAKPVYGYLRGHSNQIRYIYVNEEGAGMDTGNLQEEMTEFADNYLWFISGNLLDGFELHNKAHGVLRATEGQTSVNGEANSVWQLRPGTAGSTLTENIFALWAEDVTYVNCQGALMYWDDNDAGSTFTFNVVETEEPEPTPVTFEFTDNEDGTITVTPSDLEATYFYNVYSPALRNQWYGGAEVNECVKIDVENYISEPETETHKGVSVVQPASWLKAFYGAEYPYGDYQLVVVAIDQVGGGYAVAGDVLVHNYTYEAPEAPEVTFPEEGKAYVVFNNDAELYLNVEVHDVKATRLAAEPEKFFFTKKDGAWIIKDEDGNFVGGHSTKGWNMASDVEQLWNVVEVEGGYAFERADAAGKYIGFDSIVLNPDDELATAAYRDKNYATAHGVFTIFEYTFPLQHTAYKVKNVDAGLYMNISAADAKNTTIEKTPEEIFFTLAEDGGFYIQDKDGNYVGAGANDWTVANTVATWNVVEVEGGYAFQRTDATSKHLGLDSVQEGSAYYRDKGAANHYAHLIMLFNTPETTPAEDLQAAIDAAKELTPEAYADVPADLFEDLAAAIAKAQPFANEDATVADINEQLAAVEAAINAIVNYVPETAEELLARLQAAVEAGKAIVAANTVGEECVAGLPGYKALDLVEAVAADVEAYEGATEVTRDEVVAVEHNVKYYNEALPCIPEVGKTYLIRNHTAGVGSGQGFSYVMTAGEEGLELVSYPSIAEVENKHLWTVSEHEFKVEDDWGEVLFSEPRYVFTNVATGQIFGYNNGKIGLSESETDMNCWYFVQKTPREIVSGSKPLPYGTLGLQYNDGGNKYTCATVDMRVSDLSISGGSMLQHGLWNTYSSAYIFEVYEPIVWDEAAPTVDVVESADDLAVKVTFNGAASVEATNYGVLAAIFDENGDAYAIAFNTLFGETVEFNKGTATLHFKKISDIREEYSNAVAESCSRIKGAVGGVDITGKVVILGKSFKVDGDKIYNDDIVADYKVEGGITTGISGVAIDADAKIFDLQGRRIAAPVKGLNIVNGSKVVR